MNRAIYILEAKRTCIGKYGGKLASIPAYGLFASVAQSLISRHPNLKKDIDEIIVGNVLSAGLGQNPGRKASFQAGYSCKIPSYTVNKVCGSGLKSVILANQAIGNDDANLIIAGGMENMSGCPYYLDKYRFGARINDQQLRDGMIYDGLFCSLIGEHMGVTAEYIAKKFNISREEQDRFAFRSNLKAIKAIDIGRFNDEICPVSKKEEDDVSVIKEDEQPRRDTSLEKLAKLKPVFKNHGTVTAGNSSTLNDGAAAVLLASESYVNTKKIKPKAIIRSYAYIGLNPKYMGLGSFYAAEKCLKRACMKATDIDLWEINEAFASQSVAVLRLLGIDPKIVNVNGGSIALGHPIGASGARILTTLLYELKKRELTYGLASLCIGGGQGIAVLIENI
jgi:acetyl-CoA C-acetyltransferase